MARDARLRPFRIGIMTIFVAIAVVFVGCIVRGIVVSLLHQGALPAPATPSQCLKTAEVCGDGMRALRAELDQVSCDFQRTGTQAERRWDDWIAGWQRQLNSLRAECCLGAEVPSDRAPLARALNDLEQLGRLYTTQLVQYAHEIGPTAERCASDLALIPSLGSSVPAPTNSPGNR